MRQKSSWKETNRLTAYVALAAGLVLFTGCAGIDYVPMSALRADSNLAQISAAMQHIPGKKVRQFGALLIRSQDRPVQDASLYGASAPKMATDRIFLLKREDSRYIAETLLFDHSNDPHAKFDRSYFALGVDRKKKSLGLRVRFQF